jgi:hypothetical protein
MPSGSPRLKMGPAPIRCGNNASFSAASRIFASAALISGIFSILESSNWPSRSTTCNGRPSAGIWWKRLGRTRCSGSWKQLLLRVRLSRSCQVILSGTASWPTPGIAGGIRAKRRRTAKSRQTDRSPTSLANQRSTHFSTLFGAKAPTVFSNGWRAIRKMLNTFTSSGNKNAR